MPDHALPLLRRTADGASGAPLPAPVSTLPHRRAAPRSAPGLERRRGWAAAFAAGLATAVTAEASPAGEEPGLLSRPATLRLGAETLRLPADETVGLLGASLMIGAADGWWVGPAVYGAATGRRGGLFVIGGEAAWRTAGPAGSRLEAGLFVGGGGGAAAPVGSGLMLRPQLGWSWPVGPGWLGVTASRVSFPTGRIGSNQVGLAYSVDTALRHAAPGRVPAGSSARSGLGFDRVWGSAGSYHAGGVRTSYGVLRAERWLSPGVLAGLETAAAAQGGADGYAELLASLGAVKSGITWRIRHVMLDCNKRHVMLDSAPSAG